MPNAIALQSIQFNAARVIGPALGGIALTQLGEIWCFGLNGLSFFAPIISLVMLKTRFYPQKTSESILVGMKQGFGFIRGQRAMVSLMVLAFCMTALGSAHDDLPPGLRQGHFPQRARHVYLVPFHLRHRLHRGSAHRRRPRQRAPQGTHRAHHAHLPGRRHLRICPLHVGLAQLPHAVRVRSISDRGLHPGEFPGAAHHHQRNARPRDEHLQLRVPRRYAHGKPVDRLARPSVFGPPRARREWTRPDGGSSCISSLVQRRVAAL